MRTLSPRSVPVREEEMRISSPGAVPDGEKEAVGGHVNDMGVDDNPEVVSTGLWDLVRLSFVLRNFFEQLVRKMTLISHSLSHFCKTNDSLFLPMLQLFCPC